MQSQLILKILYSQVSQLRCCQASLNPPILRSLETFLQSPNTLSGLRVARSNTCRNVGQPGCLLSKDEANGPHESCHWRPFLQVNTVVITIIKVCMIKVLYFVVRAPVNRRIIFCNTSRSLFTFHQIIFFSSSSG